jgi:hypothetical protein
MSIAVEAETYRQLLRALLDLKDNYDGVTFTVLDEAGPAAVAADELKPATKRLVGRFTVVKYLENACTRTLPPLLKVAYIARGTSERTVRTVKPIRVSRGYLVAEDVEKQGIRTLLLDNIEYVEGPAML